MGDTCACPAQAILAATLPFPPIAVERIPVAAFFAVCSPCGRAEASGEAEDARLLGYVVRGSADATPKRHYQALTMARTKGGMVYRLLLK